MYFRPGVASQRQTLLGMQPILKRGTAEQWSVGEAPRGTCSSSGYWTTHRAAHMNIHITHMGHEQAASLIPEIPEGRSPQKGRQGKRGGDPSQ